VSGKCTLGSCGRFTGATGTAWETKKTSPALGGQPGFSDLNTGSTFYAAGGTNFDLYTATTDTWTPLAAIPTSVTSWVAPLWTAPDTIYMFGGGAVMQYTISSNSWTTVKSGLSTYTSAQSAHDDAGHLFTLQTDGNIAQFDIATGTVTTLAFTAGGMSEPRMTYDSCAKKLYLAPQFTSGTLYSYDPVTKTTATLKSHPDGFMNDVFCSDRSGHVYAAGASGGTDFWQYTTATDTWTSLPAMPADHGDNGACGVTEDGWLYTVPMSGGIVYRLQLK
jgi:outer membrane protein assembly factor BamB